MGKALVTVPMSAGFSADPNIGWFDGGAPENPGEDEVRLAGAAGPRRWRSDARRVSAERAESLSWRRDP
jgi:hypothetical protein